MSEYIPIQLRRRVTEVDRHRCCYCLTTEANSGITMTLDHIYPRSLGGETCFENLCLACPACNTFKSDYTEAQDALTQEVVPLFHPRRQQWTEHFVWTPDKTKVEGATPTGRVTVETLRMNRPVIVIARQRWVRVGWHPPTE